MKITMLIDAAEASEWFKADGIKRREMLRQARRLAKDSGRDVEIRARELGPHRELLFSTRFDPPDEDLS